jgi:dihydrolipoamide dehydrogenase
MPKKSKRTIDEKYDVVIIGSGAAGFAAAESAVGLGASVCIIEADAWGGECPNYACVPAKSLIRSAVKYREAKVGLSEFGITARSVTFNFSKIMQRKEDIVMRITGDHKRILRLAKEMGIRTVKGRAVFVDGHTVHVGTKHIAAKSFIIATGTVDFIPPINGINSINYLTYRDVMSLSSLPKSVLIIGGGPVGCEFATFFGYLGCSVTVAQLASTILNREDAEIASLASQNLQAAGIRILTNTKTLSVKNVGKRIRVTLQEGARAREEVVVDHVIMAAGKRANIEKLDLEKAEVNLDDKGRLITSEEMQTSQKHIFAAGDVSGGFQFTHVAHEEGYVAGANAAPKTKTFLKRDMRVVPRVTFIHPELASVGLTPEEASKKKKDIIIGRFAVGSLARALTDGKRGGLLKIVVDKKTGQVLGGHMIGSHAGEVIHEVALAMHTKRTVNDIANMIHAFPTYSEALAGAASSVL